MNWTYFSRCTSFLMVVLFIWTTLSGQIVNIEKKRIEVDTLGWFGGLQLNLAAQRTSKNLFSMVAGSHVWYQGLDHSFLIFGEYGLVRAEGQSFSNNGFGHIRFDKNLTEHIKWEVFSQVQHNSLTKINLRWLTGAGSRFQLTDYENALFFWGILYMIEVEELSNPEISNLDHRLSTYFSFTLLPQDDVSFISTTYMQPRLDNWNDYRILNENSLSLGITDKLSLSIRFTLAYDKEPPIDIPGLTYSLLNGLSYNF